MGDSSSFTSLFALVENHLSQSNIQQDCQTSNSGLGFRLPPLNLNKGSSDTRLPSPSVRFPIPSTSSSEHPINDVLSRQVGSMFHTTDAISEVHHKAGTTPMSDCPINDVLAMQISNMFKARQAREEEEKRKLAQKEAEASQQASCMIDLMAAIQHPPKFESLSAERASSSSSMESLVMPDIIEDTSVKVEEEADLAVAGPSRPISPLKPIITDMSYILKHKIGKCSEFGKVLCARYRPVAAPYLRVHVPNKNIKVFDFSTPSPDDIMKERLRRPTFYSTSNNTLSVFD